MRTANKKNGAKLLQFNDIVCKFGGLRWFREGYSNQAIILYSYIIKKVMTICCLLFKNWKKILKMNLLTAKF